jgi:hypothetical protein
VVGGPVGLMSCGVGEDAAKIPILVARANVFRQQDARGPCPGKCRALDGPQIEELAVPLSPSKAVDVYSPTIHRLFFY